MITAWASLHAAATDQLHLHAPRLHGTWEAAATATLHALEPLILTSTSPAEAERALECVRAQLAGATPGQALHVTVSAQHGNAMHDYAASVTPVLVPVPLPLTQAQGALTQAALQHATAPTVDTALTRDLAADRLRTLLQHATGREILDAPGFLTELDRALEAAADASDGDVRTFELRVAGRSAAEFTRLIVLPLCDWNSADEGTLGRCGTCFHVPRDEALHLHARYLHWIADRHQAQWTVCPGSSRPTCENPAAAGHPHPTPWSAP